MPGRRAAGVAFSLVTFSWLKHKKQPAHLQVEWELGTSRKKTEEELDSGFRRNDEKKKKNRSKHPHPTLPLMGRAKMPQAKSRAQRARRSFDVNRNFLRDDRRIELHMGRVGESSCSVWSPVSRWIVSSVCPFRSVCVSRRSDRGVARRQVLLVDQQVMVTGAGRRSVAGATAIPLTPNTTFTSWPTVAPSAGETKNTSAPAGALARGNPAGRRAFAAKPRSKRAG